MAGEIRKYALIINGDTEERHLQNVDRSIGVLKRQGYETFVASPSKPGQMADHYVPANITNIRELIAELRSKISEQDELVIYTTGHGEGTKDAGSLCLRDGCDYKTMSSLLEGIRYGRRTVIMDQCYGGNWDKLFLKDPRTLFISSGSKTEKVCCQEFAPNFWAEKVPDLNRDGKINWQERYANVMNNVSSSVPQFIPSPGYIEEGTSPFKPAVLKIEDKDKFGEAIKGLKHGQYALVLFSATWCSPCQDYKPTFERVAKDANGQHLFLSTENEKIAKEYGVSRYPTVMIISADGPRAIVINQNSPLNELTQIKLSPKQLLLHHLAAAEKIGDETNRSNTLRRIASWLAEIGSKDKAVEVFQRAIAAADKIGNDKNCSETLRDISFALARAGLEGKTLGMLFRQLIAVADKIGDEKHGSFALRNIASDLLGAGLKDMAVEAFEKATVAADDIGNEESRADALRAIAYMLAMAGFKYWTVEVFNKALAAADKIGNEERRSFNFAFIASSLAKAGLEDKAVEAFKRSIVILDKEIENEEKRLETLKDIASVLEEVRLKGKEMDIFRQLVTVANKLKNKRFRSIALEDINFELAKTGRKITN